MDLGTKLYLLALVLGHLAVFAMFIPIAVSLHRESKYYDRERKRYRRERRARKEAT